MKSRRICNVTERTKGIYRVKNKDKVKFEIQSVANHKAGMMIIYKDGDIPRSINCDKYGNGENGELVVFEGYPVVSVVVAEDGEEKYSTIVRTEMYENKSDIVERLKKFFGRALFSITFHKKGDGL